MILAAVFWLALAAPARAADCVPPAFYTSLPRDREWYYGVARDPDTDKARDLAIRNLGKQAAGDIEGWDAKDVEAVAGPCRDKWEVAASVGKLLPKSSLLAGWEQDDFERCGAQSYVLVRIEKDRVARFVRGNGRFKSDVEASLSKRLEKVESDVSALKARLERLEAGLGKVPEGKAAALVERVAVIRASVDKGAPAAKVEKSLAAAESDFEALKKRMAGYQTGRDKAETERLAALTRENAPVLAENLKKIDAGHGDFASIARAIGIYDDTERFEETRKLARRVLDAGTLKGEGHEDFVAYMGIVADSRLKEDDRLLKDGEEFLKRFPGSNMYESVKAQMNGIMMMRSMASAAPAHAPQPCPASGGRP